MDINEQIIVSIREMRDEMKAINKNIVDMKVVQGQNQVILQEHIRRTEANEALISLTKEENSKRIEKIEQFKWYFAGIAVLMTVAADILRRLI